MLSSNCCICTIPKHWEAVPGLIKSLVFSLVIVGLTGLLVKVKIKLKV